MRSKLNANPAFSQDDHGNVYVVENPVIAGLSLLIAHKLKHREGINIPLQLVILLL
jgi:hypothetical protein